MTYKYAEYEYVTKNYIFLTQSICDIFVTKQQNEQNSSVIQNTCIIARVALIQLYYSQLLHLLSMWSGRLGIIRQRMNETPVQSHPETQMKY